MAGPLDDITVLEVANWVAAPSCGVLMADMGAQVIKVEPLAGDSMRGKLRQPSGPEHLVAIDVPFHLDNRGKQSIAVDLADPRGGELIRELAVRADVVITNLLPGRLSRYGLAPEQVLAANPAVVYGLVTGYGTSGEDADRIAFDLTAFFGRGAIMSLVGEADSPPPSFRPGQGDHPTGLALLVAVLAALRVRDRTGVGQVVEAALLRTAAWTIGCDVSAALVDKKQPSKRGRDKALSPINTRYQMGDGSWVVLSARDTEQWTGFCNAIGRPDLASDDRFDTPLKRYRNGPELMGILDDHFATKPLEHWAPLLDRSKVVWAKVAELTDLIVDPAARRMGMFTEIDHPEAGRFETMTAPFSLSGSDVAVRGPAPGVGQHTGEVLRRLGIGQDRIDELAAAGVLGGNTQA